MSYFSDLGLAEPIVKALNAKGYSEPSPIQRDAIPSLMDGRDLCGIAQTGTGKTAAFALPSLHYFHENPKPRPIKGCRMLVLSPTRELAAQIAQSFRDYGRFLRLSVECVFGGIPVNRNIRKLAGGCDILVATPGRLLDLIEQRALHLRDVEIFVLDEADQMMDMGFIEPLKRIDKLLPKERQSLFFSATMPKSIAALSKRFLNDPLRVEVAPQSTTAERVRQQVTFINQKEKQALLTLHLQSDRIERALVFTRTKHGADRVVRHLTGAGVEAAAIHGNKSQAQRTTALQAFKAGQIKILVATDIAARGIDVSGISHVFNFEIPNVPEQYVHRIGRTARAGAEGIAISFVDGEERAYLKDIERVTGAKLEPLALPEDFQARAALLPKAAKKVSGGGNGNRGPRSGGGRSGGERSGGGRGRPGGGGGGRGRGPNRACGGGGGNRDGGRDGAQRDGGQRGGGRDGGQRSGGQRNDGAGNNGGQNDGGAKRSFRPRSNDGVGRHKHAVKRSS